jgi:hypothetical protein
LNTITSTLLKRLIRQHEVVSSWAEHFSVIFVMKEQPGSKRAPQVVLPHNYMVEGVFYSFGGFVEVGVGEINNTILL